MRVQLIAVSTIAITLIGAATASAAPVVFKPNFTFVDDAARNSNAENYGRSAESVVNLFPFLLVIGGLALIVWAVLSSFTERG